MLEGRLGGHARAAAGRHSCGACWTEPSCAGDGGPPVGALVLLSLYPASQVYEVAEDARRGDRTFAVRYGLVGVRRCFLACYPPGVLLLAGTLAIERRWLIERQT